jgi:hypothetical protein
MKEYNEQNRKTLVEEPETSIELKNLDSNQSQTSIHEEKGISRNSQILGDNKGNEKHESLLIDIEKKREELIILYIIKDYLMITFLLLSSSVNFSIPYIPFIILGITYIFLSLRFKYNVIKRIIEIFSLLYSFLLLVEKVIIWTLINKNYFEYDDYSSFLHNFGIKIDGNEKIFEIFISFIGEISLFLISIISFIISRMYKDFDFNNISFSNESFNTKIQAIIYLGYISILFNAIYNKSFLTIIYLIFYQILIILFSKKDHLIYLELQQ